MANPPKPWKAKDAMSSRSSCNFRRTSRTRMRNDGSCALRKAKQINSIDDVEGIDSHRIRSSTMQCGIEVSQTCRATCKCCGQKIVKGQVRISSKSWAKGVPWHHANCFMELHPYVQVQRFSGWDNLPPSDQEAVLAHAKVVPSSTKTGSSSKYSTSSKSARRSGESMLSDARWPSGADDWNEYEARLADALCPLVFAKLVTLDEVNQVSTQFQRSTTRLLVFLQLPSPDQVQYIRDMLANPPVV